MKSHRVAWVMPQDHEFEFVVGNPMTKQAAESMARDGNRLKKGSAFVVPIEVKSKPRAMQTTLSP